jgi:hypothetical protein
MTEQEPPMARPVPSTPAREIVTNSTHRGGLKVGQWVALGIGILALVGGAAIVGASLQRSRDHEHEAAQAREIAIANNRAAAQAREIARAKRYAAVQAQAIEAAGSKINALSGQIAEFKRRLGTIGNALKSAEVIRQSLEGEIAFVSRYSAYQSAPSDSSRLLLADALCATLAKSKSQEIRVDFVPLSISQSEIQHGLSPEHRALLEHYGISSETLLLATQPSFRVTDVATPSPIVRRMVPTFPVVKPNYAVQSARAIIEKRIENIHIVHAVTFPDGLSFAVPQAVAVLLGTRSQCAP